MSDDQSQSARGPDACPVPAHFCKEGPPGVAAGPRWIRRAGLVPKGHPPPSPAPAAHTLGLPAPIPLAVHFMQDMRKNTYELLHTKPISATQYVIGKVAGGFLISLIILAILNLVFWVACMICTSGNGFEIRLTDFLLATCQYILPNMLMIVCVYTIVALLFKNPLPAVPLLFLYMIYSNMGSQNAEGVYGYYGRPLAIMVRFPGMFFDVTPPPMAMVNQICLLIASAGIILIGIQIWRRRRI